MNKELHIESKSSTIQYSYDEDSQATYFYNTKGELSSVKDSSNQTKKVFSDNKTTLKNDITGNTSIIYEYTDTEDGYVLHLQ